MPGQPQGVYRFDLPPGKKTPNRLAFEHESGITLLSDWMFRFELHTPSSSAMYPDITKGDHGFPTVSLQNEEGSVFRFARGNIKDFFDIGTPNKKQIVDLPLASFLFDIYLQSNPKPAGNFFDRKITKITFDFLSHPAELIDIEVGSIEFVPRKNTLPYAFEDVVELRNDYSEQPLSASWTERPEIQLSAKLLSDTQDHPLTNKPLYWVLWQDNEPQHKGQIFLKPSSQRLTIPLDNIGQYQLRFRIEAEGERVSLSERSVLRVQPRSQSVSRNVLGISDEAQYKEIASLGGTYERMPVKLQNLRRTDDGQFRFPENEDPLDSFPVLTPGRRRSIALFALPKWLSSQPERSDYYRYAPADWTLYAQVVAWLVKKAQRANVGFVEVWNEASVIGHWAGSMEELLKLHQTTSEQVRQHAPEIKVLGGCSHTWSFEFLQDFMQQGGSRYCDGISLHGYTYQPEQYVAYFDELEKIATTDEGTPHARTMDIHITEIGFRSPAFTEWMQSVYFSIYTLEAASRPAVASIYWFRFFNPREETYGNYNQRASTGYAMIGYEGMYCRAALGAYRWLDNLLTADTDVTT